MDKYYARAREREAIRMRLTHGIFYPCKEYLPKYMRASVFTFEVCSTNTPTYIVHDTYCNPWRYHQNRTFSSEIKAAVILLIGYAFPEDLLVRNSSTVERACPICQSRFAPKICQGKKSPRFLWDGKLRLIYKNVGSGSPAKQLHCSI